ncbi:uncharacterized protein LOC141613361 [Silene latifolia]|uniref:uncharacterized protein LOC141613361 n=1 Tax=Silene latifolia TaxID=37657 RepID=UPI003D782FB0
MTDFQSCIDHCQFFDSLAAGSFYTWNNKQDPPTRVYSRLDRVLVNSDWIQARGNSYAHFYNEGIFDHTPCVVQDASHMKGRRSFKYYNMWSQVPEFLPCIQHHWNTYSSGTKMFRVVMKLKSLKKPLKDLNKHLFLDIENSVAHACKALDVIQTRLRLDPTNADLISQEKEAANVFRDLHSACYSFFVQKTKATNYYEGLLGTAAATTPVSLSVVQLGPVYTAHHCDLLLSPVVYDRVGYIICDSIVWFL